MATDWNGFALTPLAGGYSGETFRVDTGEEELVVRIYRRDPARCQVDAALLRLLAGILPVPAVVEQRLPDGANGPGVLVTQRLDGERLDVVLPAASPDDLVVLGTRLGELLARLSGIPMPGFGWLVGPDLRVVSEGAPTDLTDWAWHFRQHGRLAAWSESDFGALLDLVDQAESRLTGEQGDGSGVARAAYARHVLVHSDFNPKNILVDPDTLQISGVLDWEFSHAGSPYADLGNLTRFERQHEFVAAVVETLVDRAPPLAPDPLTLGRCADLWALVELAGNPVRNPVRGRASELLLAQARSHELSAWPWPVPRVDPVPTDPVS